MEFTVRASPTAYIRLTRYDREVFPKFQVVFEAESPFKFLAQEPEQANTAVVMENLHDKDITALKYCWVNSVANGSESRNTASTDSYALDVYHPVLRVGDRKLISQSATLDESLLDHVLLGGGAVGGTSYRPHIAGVAALGFEIDMALFADGELGGPDTDNFAAELHCRKPAAQFIATQIRSAKTEGRDVTPVLSALLEMPQLGRPDDARAIR